MNKSLLTNIASLSLIFIGKFTPVGNNTIFTMGLYSFSGAITNWLAVHMLFEKVPGLYGSGIITERFQEFKAGIRNLIIKQFFNKENVEKFIQGQTSSQSISDKLDFDQVFTKIKQAIVESPFGGMLAMFGGEAALEPLKPNFEAKFQEIIDDILNNGAIDRSNVTDQMLNQVNELIDKRLDELTPIMVKEIIQEMIRSHLGWLVVWGGVFGAVIGLVSTLI